MINLDPSPVILTLLLHCLLPPAKGDFNYTLLPMAIKEKTHRLYDTLLDISQPERNIRG
jgi:hypothetical protein